jgi:hypothetical protein
LYDSLFYFILLISGTAHDQLWMGLLCGIQPTPL